MTTENQKALEVFNGGTVKRWPSEKKGETFNFTESEAAFIRAAITRAEAPQDGDVRYRHLEEGEIVQEGDEIDNCANACHDEAVWQTVTSCIGDKAPDPRYLSHRQYRRPIRAATAPIADLGMVRGLLEKARLNLSAARSGMIVVKGLHPSTVSNSSYELAVIASEQVNEAISLLTPKPPARVADEKEGE